ncbi:methyl-accepting chemotaxis protein [Photobacterium galatheae]|uniref:Chemotaxis protein n=1 Tax=Photobacterium galatheae TaxID=1654360 RepID=A0A066RQL3_9GAMM|nr:methyl-accepting chemotaxis protein [Photobacterium galatheae]KDM92715.1 chemotaxis protein [Photobacterium galatheae]MCM0149367.1 methyl-accepting chemotaxis protein [Photobacterium galatheae]
MNIKHLSIRQKLTLAMSIAVIASCALVGYLSLSKSQEIIQTRLLKTELPTRLTQFRDKVESEVKQLQSASQQLASNIATLKLLEQPVSAADNQQLIEQLNSLKAQYGLNDASIANRQTGDYWNQNGFLRRLNPAQDSWFFGFRDSNKSRMVQVFREANGELKLFVNYQQVNGKGMAGFSRSFNDMAGLLSQFKLEQSGFVVLTDAQGVIQLDPKTRNPDKSRLVDRFGPDSRVLLEKSPFNLFTTEYQGEKLLLASSYIPSIDWFLIAQVPEKEVFAQLAETSQHVILLVVLTTLAFIALAIYLSHTITGPIQQAAETFRELGEGDGDLSRRIPVSGKDEMAQLAEGFNAFANKIHTLVADVAATGTELRVAAEDVSTHAKTTLSHSQNQRDRTLQVATAINEMGATVNEIAGNAAYAAESASQATSATSNGQQVVLSAQDSIEQLAGDMNNMARVISDLADNTVAIGGILEVIRGVSEQTNLLALNAAIEAARAGEQGRGFAVVAEEVRNLASRTAKSTDEIQTMIDRLQQEAQNAVNAMQNSQQLTEAGTQAADDATKALQLINEQILQISDLNTQVATATEEQSTVVSDINVNIEEINENTQRTSETANQMVSSSQNLHALSVRLERMVSSFKQ